MKKPITLISVVLCCFVILGDVLVLKPDFIFSTFETDFKAHNETEDFSSKHNNHTEDIEDYEDGLNYLAGVTCALYVAISGALGM